MACAPCFTWLTRPNAVNTTYAYDPISRLTSILHKLGTTTLDGATYTYDNAGNRKTRTDKRLNTTLTYGGACPERIRGNNIYQLLSTKQVRRACFHRPTLDSQYRKII